MAVFYWMPTKFEGGHLTSTTLYIPSQVPINLRDIINVILSLQVFFISAVIYKSLFFRID